MLPTCVPGDFMKLFYNDLAFDIPDTQSKLNLRILKIENNSFCYDELVRELSNAVISFSTSKKEFDRLTAARRVGDLYRLAVQKFRDYNTNEGEAGELLLYCFLEAHLNAPKILTKLEIKTSSNDYVKGSDGIHLLKVDEKNYQLIFGESKLHANLTSSITNAFDSISDFITRPKNNLQTEIGLLNSQLCKEAIDENLYALIKSIIFPDAAQAEIFKDNAFAIFAGFDIDITEEQKLKNDECRAAIRKKVKEEVEKRIPHIQQKIKDLKLFGYTFYVYVFPFCELDIQRKEIIKKLVEI